MILDKLENLEKYRALHPGIGEAVAWLKTQDLGSLAAGRHDVIPDGRMYVNVQDDVILKSRSDANPEFHRKYIDIQVVICGTEEMGWMPLPENIDQLTEFDSEKDVGFLKAPVISWNTVPAGYFAIFMPQDIHAPCCGAGMVKKLVVKVLL